MSDLPITWPNDPVMKVARFRRAEVDDGAGGKVELQYRDDLADGSARWTRRDDGTPYYLNFVCPCGCKAVSGVPVVDGFGTRWQWDGNEQAPTLTPSILKRFGCKWHGFLTAGSWKTC